MLSNAGAASPVYLLLAAACLVLFYLSRDTTWRKMVLGGFSLAVVLSQSTNPAPLLLIFAFPVFCFLTTILIQRHPTSAVYLTAIACVVCVFLLVKRYWFMPKIGALEIFSTLGLSYMLFRAFHVFSEVKGGMKFGWKNLGSYLRYQVSPFNLFAGPINHYDAYLKNENEIGAYHSSADVTYQSLARICVGLIKVIAVSQVLFYGFSVLKGWGDFYLALAGLTFLTYIYVNFSGYMDIVIGLARLFGIQMPENFDRPWMAASFINFWTRWHITLSFFFRDYLFYPMLASAGRLSRSRQFLTLASIFISFIVFFLMGVWHGTTPMFILLGFALAIGICVNQIWSEFVAPFFNIKIGRLTSALLGHLAGAVTVLYFALSAVLVWPEITSATKFFETASGIWSPPGLAGVVLAILLLISARILTVIYDNASAAFVASSSPVRIGVLGVLVACNVLLIGMTTFAPSPQIYYQDF